MTSTAGLGDIRACVGFGLDIWLRVAGSACQEQTRNNEHRCDHVQGVTSKL